MKWKQWVCCWKTKNVLFQSSYLLEIKILLHYGLAKQAIIDNVLSGILFDDIAAKREKQQEKLRNNIGRGWYQELPIFAH